MTPALFRARLAECGLTQAAFARATGMGTGAVNRWASTSPARHRRVPPWVESWLDLYARVYVTPSNWAQSGDDGS